MKFMVTASWTVAAGNAAARAGTMGETIQSILDDIKPEAVYFAAEGGMRTTIIVVDMTEASEIPAVAEPFFLAFDASIDIKLLMEPEDLAKAGPAIEAAVKKFG
jgi:hypothetical protein